MFYFENLIISKIIYFYISLFSKLKMIIKQANKIFECIL